jgi:acyl-CoA thioesterase I
MFPKAIRPSAALVSGAVVLLAAVMPAPAETPDVTTVKGHLAAVPPVRATAAPSQATKDVACRLAVQFNRFQLPLPHTARRLHDGKPIKIVAVGSSSTEGAGASSKAATYPSRLGVELTRLFPGREISVLNRGIGGEVAADMVARFDKAVIAEHPDLILWQVGTNAVLRDEPLKPAGTLIREGLAKLKATGADVVLIDPQYAPKVLKTHDVEGMVALIARAAKEADVDLFHRFALMQRWRETENIPFGAFLSKDGLHMNDWSYRCVAKYLASAIADAVNRPTETASFASQF